MATTKSLGLVQLSMNHVIVCELSHLICAHDQQIAHKIGLTAPHTEFALTGQSCAVEFHDPLQLATSGLASVSGFVTLNFSNVLPVMV